MKLGPEEKADSVVRKMFACKLLVNKCFLCIIFVKGRVKCTNMHMTSLLRQMHIRTFDERSDPAKP